MFVFLCMFGSEDDFLLLVPSVKRVAKLSQASLNPGTSYFQGEKQDRDSSHCSCQTLWKVVLETFRGVSKHLYYNNLMAFTSETEINMDTLLTKLTHFGLLTTFIWQLQLLVNLIEIQILNVNISLIYPIINECEVVLVFVVEYFFSLTLLCTSTTPGLQKKKKKKTQVNRL